MTDALALSRLLQLASPMLPVGAYSYSQGLESAIDMGVVIDAETTRRWIADVFHLGLCRFELPILLRMMRAWQDRPDKAATWNETFVAGRDTVEARAETLQMGYSLTGLLRDLGGMEAAALARLSAMAPVSFPLAFACAASTWKIPELSALQGYAWSWVENQVSAAMKTVPIGQVAGQRILFAMGDIMPHAIRDVAALGDDDIGNFVPGLSLAGCRHETQYTRLFRS